jgi:pimeloyl-ACP methyl ester carboxylesterase
MASSTGTDPMRRSYRARVVLSFALFAVLSPCLFAQTASADPLPAETLWPTGNGLKLKTTIYHSATLSDHPVLVVVLHGDLLGYYQVPPLTYTYLFADQASRKIEDVVVAAVLRPGYRDATGERSDGDAGLATGDNYTPAVVAAVAAAIGQLQAKFHPAHTVLVGHSGGAAISADLLGRLPSAVDGALLASCPCDLVAWRAHMMRKKDNNPIWSMPIHALSPQQLANKVSPAVHVSVLVGAGAAVDEPALRADAEDALQVR